MICSGPKSEGKVEQSRRKVGKLLPLGQSSAGNTPVLGLASLPVCRPLFRSCSGGWLPSNLDFFGGSVAAATNLPFTIQTDQPFPHFRLVSCHWLHILPAFHFQSSSRTPSSLSKTISVLELPRLQWVSGNGVLWNCTAAPQTNARFPLRFFPLLPPSLLVRQGLPSPHVTGPSSAANRNIRRPHFRPALHKPPILIFFPQLPAWPECANHRNVPNIDVVTNQNYHDHHSNNS